jgi:hypothetical protein
MPDRRASSRKQLGATGMSFINRNSSKAKMSREASIVDKSVRGDENHELSDSGSSQHLNLMPHGKTPGRLSSGKTVNREKNNASTNKKKKI